MATDPDAFGWTVEHPDLEQPPRLVWWHPDHLNCAVIDVDDVMYSIEDIAGSGVDLAGLSEQAITDLCALVTEIERLRSLLVEANDAFDECAGDYSAELVHDEPWREFRRAEAGR